MTTVFRRRGSLPSVRASSQEIDATESWRQIPLPIRHTNSATLLLRSTTRADTKILDLPRDEDSHPSANSTAITLNKSSSYRITTHHEYVVYQGIEDCGVWSEEEGVTESLAIYRVTYADSGDTVRLVACVEGNGALGSIHQYAIHPEYPLLAFRFLSRARGSQIVMWSFDDGLSRPDGPLLRNHDIVPSRDPSECPIAYITPVGSRLKHLQFSACGTCVVYQQHNSTYPHTIALQDSPVYQLAKEAFEKERNHVPHSASNIMPTASSTSVLVEVNTMPDRMQMNDTVLHSHGSSSTLSFDSACSNRSIMLRHSTGHSIHEQSLLSLPAWSDMKYISPSVRMPKRSDKDKLTIILNKTAQSFYMLGRAGEQTAPTIVRKDTRAIPTPTLQRMTHEGIAGVEAGWRGILSWDENTDYDEGQARKRLRTGDA
jgi:hypothetical protein